MKLKKLTLKKETIVSLERSEQQMIMGGTGASCAALCQPVVVSGAGCDVPTIGHDDGPNCVSASDAWCWCYGS